MRNNATNIKREAKCWKSAKLLKGSKKIKITFTNSQEVKRNDENNLEQFKNKTGLSKNVIKKRQRY